MKKLVTFCLFFLNIFAQAPTPQDSWFRFDGDLNEASGRLYQITNFGAVFTSDRFNRSDRALQFNGTSSYLQFLSEPQSDSTFDAFTYSAWLMPAAFPAVILAKQAPVCPANDFALYLDSSFVVVNLADSAFILRLNHNISLGAWHHFSIAWDGDSIKCYIDGAITGKKSIKSAIFPPRKGLLIGSNYASGRYYSGKLDDLHLYNFAVSEKQADSIAHSADSSACLALVHPAGIEGAVGGTCYTISWESFHVSSVRLDYSTDDGNTWAQIAAAVPASPPNYSWITPRVVNLKCKIRVRDNDSLGLIAVNTYPFAIIDSSVYLGITALLEAFYNPETGRQIPDTILVSLRKADTAYTIIDSARIVLDSLGLGFAVFSKSVKGKYYLVVNHRNHIETWSSVPLLFSPGTFTV